MTSVLIFSFFVCRGNLVAEERYGARLVVYKLGRQWIKGELIAVRQNSLLLLSSEGADVSVDIKDIYTATIEKKSQALIGGLVGIACGVAAGGLIASRQQAEEGDWFPGFEQIPIYLISVLLGTTFGIAVGASFGTDKIIEIKGKSDTEIKKILEKLRRQARITNAQ